MGALQGADPTPTDVQLFHPLYSTQSPRFQSRVGGAFSKPPRAAKTPARPQSFAVKGTFIQSERFLGAGTSEQHKLRGSKF